MGEKIQEAASVFLSLNSPRAKTEQRRIPPSAPTPSKRRNLSSHFGVMLALLSQVTADWT